MPVLGVRHGLAFGPAMVLVPLGLVLQAMPRGELPQRDPVSSPDEFVPVGRQRLPLLESYVCAWHVLCDMLFHGVIPLGLMFCCGDYHHARTKG